MRTYDTVSEGGVGESEEGLDIGSRNSVWDRMLLSTYAAVLAISVSIWFIAVRAPLWLDETGSFWQIDAGFSKIISRQYLSFPAYSYLLWFWTRIVGTSEIALRILSVLAMLGAVYLLYRAVYELFDREVAYIAAIIFCVHPIVIFAAIDVRPYAFGALAANAAILSVVRMRTSHSNWLAALFGFSTACIVWFHLLFVVILPALAICYFAIKPGDQRKILWRQAGVALATFVAALLPVTPWLFFMFHSSSTHVFEDAPKLSALAWTLAPGWLPVIFGGAAFVFLLVAASRTHSRQHGIHFAFRQILISVSLAMVPILILYSVSAETPLHIFIPRHRLVAVPGIALCWALLVRMLSSRVVRFLFCIALVATTACMSLSSPSARQHGYTWKYALDVAEKNASVDDAPVLICSDFPEADYVAMPMDSAKNSNLFTPLSYYRLSVPVVPLPRALNDEAMRVGSVFLQQAAQRRERFLALANTPSYKTLDWLANSASATHDVHKLGVFDGVEVLEFEPRH